MDIETVEILNQVKETVDEGKELVIGIFFSIILFKFGNRYSIIQNVVKKRTSKKLFIV